MKRLAASFIAVAALAATTEVGMTQGTIARADAPRPMSRVNVDGVELEYEPWAAGIRSCSSMPASSPTGSHRS